MKDQKNDMMGGDPLLHGEEDGEISPIKSTIASIRMIPHYHDTSTQKSEMDLHSGISHKMFASVVHMGVSHETSLSCGIPPRRPPDSYLMKDVSCIDSHFIDTRRKGALEDNNTVSRVWERFMEREIIFPLSPLSIFHLILC